MKNALMSVLLLWLCFGTLPAQNEQKPLKLRKYYLSRQIAEGLAQGTREMRLPFAAQFYSYIGKYHQAQRINNEIGLEWGFDTVTAEDRSYFAQFEAREAVAALLKRTVEEKVVIINEAHHKPRHRLLTRSLLQGLYDQGYRYFGLETLSFCTTDATWFCDTLLNERGYPLNAYASGTYVTEPQMAMLIREAISIGFQLFPYEDTSQDRDRMQAQHIADFMAEHPNGKVLIHCGWYHLLEAENEGRKWMAEYLREMTGINPFTIYQDILIERYCSPESPFFNMVGTYDQPTVFVNAGGDFYNGHAGFNKFDVLVYHPRTRYVFNRPDWLVHYPGNRIYRPERPGIAYPVLVKAFRSTESDEATPIDIIELEYEADQTVMVLPAGNYRLEFVNEVEEREVREVRVE